MKRDWIFFAALGVALAGVGLFIAGITAGILLVAAAYLLRPALHECGLARGHADERQLLIHSRSGNIGFLVVILGAAGFSLWRLSRGEAAEDLLQIIAIGLAARALTNLVMLGEYRKAGVMILTAIGVGVALFLIAEGGLSAPALAGVVIGGCIIGIAQIARRFPTTIAAVLLAVMALAIVAYRLYEFHAMQSAVWLLFIMPLAVATLCLYLGRGEDDNVSPRLRTVAFGSMGAAAVVIFTLLLIFGGHNMPVTRRTAAGPAGTVTMIQGIPCTGTVTYDDRGRLQSCTLGREDTLSGQALAAGTVIHLTPDGILDWCFLEENTMIQGHLCLGSGHNYMTGFHPNGTLKTAWLAQDEMIDGIPCAKFRFLSSWFGGGDRTSFHENGRLQFCTLAAPATIGGTAYRKNARLTFTPDGQVIMPDK